MLSSFVGYIYEDKHGNIWTSSQIANSQKWVITRYDAKLLTDKAPAITEIKSQYEGNKGMLFGIAEAKDGSILVGAFDGLYRYDGSVLTKF